MTLPKKAFPNPSVIFPLDIPFEALDRDALNIIDRLDRRGYLSFFVGGCIRDLLLDQIPKDFDVVTLARPKEIKNLFRNARLIGKRFQLAHLVYPNKKIIEVATFRKQPSTKRALSGEMIIDDNEFGSPQTDANRRDFTINALLYDPVRHLLIDEMNGLQDLKDKIIRCIGDPVTRMREDPIRMLRAVRLAARLGFEIEDRLAKAIYSERFELVKAAHPRFEQELYRTLQSRQSKRAFELLDEYGILPVLIPEIHAYWTQNTAEKISNKQKTLAMLNALDLCPSQEIDESVLFSALFWSLFQELTQGCPSHLKLNEDFCMRLLAPFTVRIGLSLRTLVQISKIFAMNLQFDCLIPHQFKGYAYELALQFLELRTLAEQIQSPVLLNAKANHSKSKKTAAKKATPKKATALKKPKKKDHEALS
jgi:poly(A) polymerase